MSTTRQHPPGDLGPEPDGIASASDASAAPASGVPAAAAPVSAAPVSGAAASGTPSSGGSASGGSASGTSVSAGAVDVPAQAQAQVQSPAQVPAGSVLAAAGQVRSLPLNGASGIVPLARDFTRQALYDWGWLPASTADRRAAAEDVLLVVSELVTNACLHAEGPESLRVASDGKVLRLEVTDRSGGEPAPRTPHRAGRPGGHGMFIVQRLCLAWGVARTPEGAGQGVGKTVWAELAAPA
ncbi:ATP-binding protein [Streptomyces sp. NPDC021093]|uniref:ATP-binding protein n=1 Tax=Streptomyces sp. NPDC021093 TaxID=3365112 RepID=UPI0037AD5AD3